jgi:hypothetical protein
MLLNLDNISDQCYTDRRGAIQLIFGIHYYQSSNQNTAKNFSLDLGSTL